MTFLFLGEDDETKESRIAKLKDKYVSTSEARNLDYEVLFSYKLDPPTLKKSLLALPAVASKRLVILRSCHQLSPHNKKILYNFVSVPQDHMALIMESSQWRASDSFVKKIKSFVKIEETSREEKFSVFDMTKAMSGRRPKAALKILFELLNDGNHPVQIMGVLVWFWGKMKARVKPKDFEHGIMALRQADINIKRSRIKPEYAVELVVVRLSGLI